LRHWLLLFPLPNAADAVRIPPSQGPNQTSKLTSITGGGGRGGGGRGGRGFEGRGGRGYEGRGYGGRGYGYGPGYYGPGFYDGPFYGPGPYDLFDDPWDFYKKNVEGADVPAEAEAADVQPAADITPDVQQQE
jgi:hypothetical protein